jgi:predicted acylesterase/phospholipase RssA/CRP-like cAMP-binding protein
MGRIASPLFANLSSSELDGILGCMKARCYATGEYICREGDTSDCMYLIESGVVEVIIGEGSTPRVLTHLRRGDIFGEMGLLNDEPRAASILAAMPTLVLELDRPAFTELINLHPTILLNISRVLVERQKKSLRSLAQSRRSEFVLLMVGRGTESLAQRILALCQSARPHGVMVVDLSDALRLDKAVLVEKTVASAMALLDNLVATAAPVILVSYCDQPDLASMIRYVDRVALLGTEADIYKASEACACCKNTIEVFLTEVRSRRSLGRLGNFRVVRVLGSEEDPGDTGWIARHLTRTKLGLALGAGGAKGFAHIGVLGVLERAGYVVDFLAGSSIGGLIGGLMGLGLNADEIKVQLKRIWTPEYVDRLADLSSEGISLGLARILDTIRNIFGDRMMSDLCLPLRVLTADLQEGEPVPLDNWPVYEAIRAGLSIPGLALPYRHGSQRLVDAVCLTPVPASFVREMGADIVMSVNLLSKQRLTAWPSEAPPMPAYKRKRTQVVDPVIETLMMLQIDTSIRNAAQADLVLTPGFPSSSWRDFSLAELFREAGQAVAEAELARLAEVAKPVMPRQQVKDRSSMSYDQPRCARVCHGDPAAQCQHAAAAASASATVTTSRDEDAVHVTIPFPDRTRDEDTVSNISAR